MLSGFVIHVAGVVRGVGRLQSRVDARADRGSQTASPTLALQPRVLTTDKEITR